MGKENDVINDFFNDPAVFADLWNGVLYGGRQVIVPERLAERQRFYHEDLENRAGMKKKVRRERDVAKLLCMEGCLVILAVENQETENLYMPLRCMEYEVEDLKKQLRHMKRRHEEKTDLEPGAEFLSGIRRTDRFIPTIQIVIYHGDKSWEAPESLEQMMNLEGMEETLKNYLTAYRIHLIRLEELNEDGFETGLRELVGMLKCKNDRTAMQKYCREHAERFETIDDRTYDVICTMLHITSLKQKKDSYRMEGRGINMCKAFDDWAKEEQRKGEKLGEKRGEKRALELMTRLIRDQRFEDADRAAGSAAVRKKLYLEYGI